MYNDLFSIGPFTVHTYGLMTAIGIISAYLLMEHLAKKKGLDSDRIFWLLIWCLVFGYLGSKILYFITILPQIVADPSIIKRSLTDGWVMYGGLLGGILGGFLYCRYKKLNAWAYFDVGLRGVILAQAFGRIGCFFAGCCYGAETHSAFCIVFTHSQFAPNNVPLIPTQLLMSAGDFLLFAFLMLYDKKKKNEGQVTGAYLTLYSLGRFTIEFFRGDVARGSVGPFSTSQFIALFVLAIGIVIWIRRTKCTDGIFKPEVKEAEAEETSENEESSDNEETSLPEESKENDSAEDGSHDETKKEDLSEDETDADSEIDPSEESDTESEGNDPAEDEFGDKG